MWMAQLTKLLSTLTETLLTPARPGMHRYASLLIAAVLVYGAAALLHGYLRPTIVLTRELARADVGRLSPQLLSVCWLRHAVHVLHMGVMCRNPVTELAALMQVSDYLFDPEADPEDELEEDDHADRFRQRGSQSLHAVADGL